MSRKELKNKSRTVRNKEIRTKNQLKEWLFICGTTLALTTVTGTGLTVFAKSVDVEKPKVEDTLSDKDKEKAREKATNEDTDKSENNTTENSESNVIIVKSDDKKELDTDLLDEVDKQVSKLTSEDNSSKSDNEDKKEQEEKEAKEKAEKEAKEKAEKEAKEKESKEVKEIEYTVKSGDTLNSIVKEHNTVLSNVQNLNNIVNPKQISVGQVLKIRVNDTEEKELPKEPEKTTNSTTDTSSTLSSTPNVSTPETTSEAKEWIAQKESGGNYNAVNGIYKGRYQLTDSYLNGDYSPENQERVADQYVSSRYGSWENAKAFWLINGWY